MSRVQAKEAARFARRQARARSRGVDGVAGFTTGLARKLLAVSNFMAWTFATRRLQAKATMRMTTTLMTVQWTHQIGRRRVCTNVASASRFGADFALLQMRRS